MSSWPPHLPMAMTASRTRRGLLPHLGAGDRERRPRACPPRGRRARRPRRRRPTWWARSRAASRTRMRRYATRIASSASLSGSVATGRSASGSAPTAVSSLARTAYAAGRVLPIVGSVRSRQWSGCRTRWSASAWLAPSTDSSRMAVPSSSTRASSSSSAIVGGLGQAQQAGQREVGVGGPAEQRDERLGVVAEPGHPVEGAVGVDEPVPEQVAAAGGRPGHALGVTGGGPRPRRTGRPAGARPPRARRGRRRSRRARPRGRALRQVELAVGLGPGPDQVGVDLGVVLDAPHGRREPRRLDLDPVGAGQHDGAVGHLGDHVVVPVHAAARGGDAWTSAGRGGRRASSRSCAARTSGRGSSSRPRRRGRRPRAGGPGRCPARVRRRRRARGSARGRGPSHGLSASSLAPIAPPSTTSPSYVAGSGSASPA